jgi:hypothetical protein
MDRSGRNNNAGQAATGLQPSLVTGVVNGLPVIRFANASLQVTDSTTLQWGTDDFAILVVAGYKNSTTTDLGYGMFVAKQETAYPYAGPALWGNYTTAAPFDTVIGLQADSGGTQYAISTAAQNDGVIRIYTGRRVGNSLEVRVNGAVQGTTNATSVNVSASGRPLLIGGRGTVMESQALDGDIAEIVAVRGALGNDDLTKLEAYLKAKYGL